MNFLNRIHNQLLSTASTLTSKLDSYNEILQGRVDPKDSDGYTPIVEEHFNYIKKIEKSDPKYFSNLSEFSSLYSQAPYHLKYQMLKEFFS